MSMPNPIVLLDARARYVHPAFQMTRASTKTVFDSTGRLVTVPANAIGWDHDPATGQARGYLAEPPATNLLLHSNDLTQGAWSKVSATVTGDAITGPDGNGMAKLVEDTTTNQHRVVQTFSISSGAAVVGQCIVAAAERSAFRLLLGDSAVNTEHISITADCGVGSVLHVGANGDAVLVGHGLVPIGAGLWLVWVAGTVGVEATGVSFQVSLSANGNLGYEGDGTSGLYLGYCQAEEGSYPTSYIETGGSTAMRAGDSLVLSGLGDFPWWRSDRGTLLITIRIDGGENASQDVVSLDIHHLYMRRHPVGNIIMSGAMVEGARTAAPALGRHKVAVSWDAGGCIVSGDGSVSSTTAVIDPLPASPTMGIGNRSSGGNRLEGYIERAVYYPARLSNADLQSLTAIQE